MYCFVCWCSVSASNNLWQRVLSVRKFNEIDFKCHWFVSEFWWSLFVIFQGCSKVNFILVLLMWVWIWYVLLLMVNLMADLIADWTFASTILTNIIFKYNTYTFNLLSIWMRIIYVYIVYFIPFIVNINKK